jgi:hypothetical protein
MFPISITLTLTTEEQLARVTAAVSGAAVNLAHAQPPEELTGKSKPAKAKKEDPKPETPKAEEKPAAASDAPPAATPDTTAQTAASDTPAEVIDYDSVIKPLFLKLVQTKGRNAARAIIDAYDKSKEKLSEAIKPAQYAEVKAKIEEALK